jgi:translation initiation factor 4E
MLAAIGETFETPYSEEADPSSPSAADFRPSSSSISPAPLPSTFSNEITGVIVSVRKAFYRINIWTRTSSPENIGRHFKYGVLGFDKGLTFSERDKVSSDVEFVSHSDSQQKVRASVLDIAACLLSTFLMRSQC